LEQFVLIVDQFKCEVQYTDEMEPEVLRLGAKKRVMAADSPNGITAVRSGAQVPTAINSHHEV
jgi:hypothetical protein